jgi:hypothetical protein
VAFSDDGKAVTNVDGNDFAYEITIQPNDISLERSRSLIRRPIPSIRMSLRFWTFKEVSL